MIVVCGNLEPLGRRRPLAVSIASCIAGQADVQMIGLVAEGRAGDRQLITLASAGVGHAAVLRAPSRPLEPADVELALRYLPDARVVVAVDVTAGLVPALVDGAAYAGATLVLIAGRDSATPTSGLPDSAIVLQAPFDDPDRTFAGFVGEFAARLDGGAAPADAWAATVRDLAVDPITPGPSRRGSAG